MRSALEKVSQRLRKSFRLKPVAPAFQEARAEKPLREWDTNRTWLDPNLKLPTKRKALKEFGGLTDGPVETSKILLRSEEKDCRGHELSADRQNMSVVSDAMRPPISFKGTMSKGPPKGTRQGTTVMGLPPSGKKGENEGKIGRDIFKMFVEEDGKMSVPRFLEALSTTGIRLNDPRLKHFVNGLNLNPSKSCVVENDKISSEEFIGYLDLPSYRVFSKAFRQKFAVRDFPALCKLIEDKYDRFKSMQEGKVADYIPQLALMSPHHFGISICTVDGQRFSIGDVGVPFTIQSMSKPLTYALCLENLGANVVHKFVGQEPSGRIFNELILDSQNRPHNPMVNAGAIVICSLVLDLVQPSLRLAEKYDMILSFIKRLAGQEHIGFNNAVFVSERDAADRNYAIAFLLREHRCFPPNVQLRNVMDFYFQCCSLEGNCDSLAVVSATLANGGTCPLTGEKILNPDSVRDTLSLMQSCGMYDYSGQFAFKAGIPAKSGVSGGIIAVIPDVLGLCCWSPALDRLGNSARGLQFCEEFVSMLNFHPYGLWDKTDVNQSIFGLKIAKILNAAYIGDKDTIERYLKSQKTFSQCDRDGRTPLHIAATEGHYEVVQTLIKYGGKAICCVEDRWGRLPIDDARFFKNTDIVELLEPHSTCEEVMYCKEKHDSGRKKKYRRNVPESEVPASSDEGPKNPPIINQTVSRSQKENVTSLSSDNKGETDLNLTRSLQINNLMFPNSQQINNLMFPNSQQHPGQEFTEIVQRPRLSSSKSKLEDLPSSIVSKQASEKSATGKIQSNVTERKEQSIPVVNKSEQPQTVSVVGDSIVIAKSKLQADPNASTSKEKALSSKTAEKQISVSLFESEQKANLSSITKIKQQMNPSSEESERKTDSNTLSHPKSPTELQAGLSFGKSGRVENPVSTKSKQQMYPSSLMSASKSKLESRSIKSDLFITPTIVRERQAGPEPTKNTQQANFNAKKESIAELPEIRSEASVSPTSEEQVKSEATVSSTSEEQVKSEATVSSTSKEHVKSEASVSCTPKRKVPSSNYFPYRSLISYIKSLNLGEWRSNVTSTRQKKPPFSPKSPQSQRQQVSATDKQESSPCINRSQPEPLPSSDVSRQGASPSFTSPEGPSCRRFSASEQLVNRSYKQSGQPPATNEELAITTSDTSKQKVDLSDTENKQQSSSSSIETELQTSTGTTSEVTLASPNVSNTETQEMSSPNSSETEHQHATPESEMGSPTIKQDTSQRPTVSRPQAILNDPTNEELYLPFSKAQTKAGPNSVVTGPQASPNPLLGEQRSILNPNQREQLASSSLSNSGQSIVIKQGDTPNLNNQKQSSSPRNEQPAKNEEQANRIIAKSEQQASLISSESQKRACGEPIASTQQMTASQACVQQQADKGVDRKSKAV